METPERRRLVDAIRRLIGEAATKDAPETTFRKAADAAERSLAALEAVEATVPKRHPLEMDPSDPHAWFPFSPVIGHVNALAAPVEVRAVDGSIEARMHFGAAYEGPPGCVHGGVIAEVFDELLGAANIVNGVAGMTGTLTIRYQRPTPLHADLEARAWVDRVDGRKIFARGEMSYAGDVTALAEGVFIKPRPERWADHFPDEARGF